MLIEIRHTSLRRNMYFLLMGTLMSRSTLVNDVNIIHIEQCMQMQESHEILLMNL